MSKPCFPCEIQNALPHRILHFQGPLSRLQQNLSAQIVYRLNHFGAQPHEAFNLTADFVDKISRCTLFGVTFPSGTF